jgi:hypothetical protein
MDAGNSIADSNRERAMPYLVIYESPEGVRAEREKTPVSAVRRALDLTCRVEGVQIKDLRTGRVSGVKAFAKAHDLEVVDYPDKGDVRLHDTPH